MSAWRCTRCGKVSQAALKPRYHWHNSNTCGPFEAATIAPEGSVLAPAGSVIAAPVVDSTPERPATYRQSLLRSFETCPRRALHEILVPDDLSVGNVEHTADEGSATHAVLGEILATLRRQGAVQMPTQEGIEVMYEVLARGDWVLPAGARDELRGFVVNFCTYYEWKPNRIVALEQRLSLDLVCPDGRTRTLTGTPDVVLADPPSGLVCVDFKTGRGLPRSPRQAPEEGAPIVGREFLSTAGTYQLDVYGLLLLRAYPAAQRITLREAWLRFGQRREATLVREELEHVEREVAVQMMLLDRAIDEGPEGKLARPRPGRHCLRGCPVKRSCPIAAELRGLGALDSPEAADREAARFVVVDALRQEQRDALKAYHEATGAFPQIPDGTQLGWKPKANGKGRDFCVFRPEQQAPGETTRDDDIASWEAELERRSAAAGVAS